MTGTVITLMLAAGFALQPVGTFHGDEPVARAGEHWLALHDAPDGMRLVAARARLRTVHDPILDADNEATGIEVAADGAPDAAMLLRGPALRAGAIERAEIADDAGSDLAAFRFRNMDYRLRPRCPQALPAPGTSQACDVVLASAAGEQAVSTWMRSRSETGPVEFDADARPTLLHAGDFDRDGRPDLILDTTDHYNVSRPTLFLSSPARSGEAVREVASHRSVGC